MDEYWRRYDNGGRPQEWGSNFSQEPKPVQSGLQSTQATVPPTVPVTREPTQAEMHGPGYYQKNENAAFGTWNGSRWITARAGAEQASSGSMAQLPVTAQGPLPSAANTNPPTYSEKDIQTVLQNRGEDIQNVGSYKDSFQGRLFVSDKEVLDVERNFVFPNGK
jgi:hypothetical protein